MSATPSAVAWRNRVRLCWSALKCKIGSDAAAAARELLDKRLAHAFADRRIVAHEISAAAAVVERELRNLARFLFGAEAEQVEARRLRPVRVHRVEGERRHGHEIAGRERGDAVARQRPDDQLRAGFDRLFVNGEYVERVFVDGVNANRRHAFAGRVRGGDKALSYGIRMAAVRMATPAAATMRYAARGRRLRRRARPRWRTALRPRIVAPRAKRGRHPGNERYGAS